MLVQNGMKTAFRMGGGSGGPPEAEAEESFKKSNKMEVFPLFLFAFWQGSLDPQKY